MSAYSFFSYDPEAVIQDLGAERLVQAYQRMLEVQQLEMRAESAYLQGKIGGFFHSYLGQEAIQVACIEAFGKDQWYTTSYRCHALALLLGATPEEIMAEFFGREEGNAKGRGGSMHLYTDRLLGGYGIVGGQVPIATGAALSAKQLGQDKVSLCFLGDGACAQGAFSESLNLASLWDLPCVYVVENNQWGMGTGVDRAICVKPIAEKKAPAYDMQSYTLDGLDFLSCYAGFKAIFEQMKKDSRPVLVEAVTERLRGHSISDPGLYRSKEHVKQLQQHSSIERLKLLLLEKDLLTEAQCKQTEKEIRARMVQAIEYAEGCSWPHPATLEEGVFKEER